MMDPYATLGLKKGDSPEDIKKAYRKLAKKYHPDVNPTDKKNEKRFKDISAAHAFLSDKKQKELYDQGQIDADGNPRSPFNRSGYSQGGQTQGSYTGAENNFGSMTDDLFRDLFGGRGRRQPQPSTGRTLKHRLTIPFLEAALGAQKDLSVNGQSLKMKIPKGCEDKQILRLRHKGEPGTNGGPAGDLLIEIHIQPHAYFHRKGQDIEMDFPLSLQEAVLGAKVSVPTIHGTVSLNIPPYSNGGQKLRLKNKGIEKQGKLAGNHYIRLQIILPNGPQPDLEELLKDEKVASYTPRDF